MPQQQSVGDVLPMAYLPVRIVGRHGEGDRSASMSAFGELQTDTGCGGKAEEKTVERAREAGSHHETQKWHLRGAGTFEELRS